jgi:hypothetical protein
VIVAVILIFKFISSLVKAVVFAFLLLIIIFSVIGLLVYLDAKDIQSNFSSSNKTILLVDNNKIILGFKIVDFADNQTMEQITGEKLVNYSEFYAKKDYKSIKGDSYKLMIFNESLFNFSAKPSLKAFSNSLSSSIKNEGIVFLIKGLKAKEIIIYPETITFKIIKYIPISLIEKVASRLVKKEQ